MKSNLIELSIPEELTEGGRYSPRFIDEISDELDVIEDKKAPFLSEFSIRLVSASLNNRDLYLRSSQA